MCGKKQAKNARLRKNKATILIVDDDQSISNLMQDCLRAKGFQTISAPACSDALKWLEHNSTDLMLLDHKLPDMTGEKMLSELRNRNQDVPFVIVTGQGDDQYAVEMMKCGARDYIVKDLLLLELLPSVVSRAIAEIKREEKLAQAEQARKETEEKFLQLAENIQDVFWLRIHGKMIYVSPAYERLWGRSCESLYEDPALFMEAVHPDDKERILGVYMSEEYQKNGEFDEEYRIVRPDGTIRWIWARAFPVKRDERIVGTAGIAEDITEHRKAGQALRNALKESRQRQAEIAMLLKSSRAVLENRKFDDAARSIFDSCKSLIGATGGYVALLNKEATGNEVLFLDAGGRPCTVDPNLLMPVRGLRAKAYRNVKTIYENNFPKSRWMEFMPDGHVALDNVLFSPLVIQSKAVGVLGLANKPGGFSDDDARMAAAFSELAAIALYNSRTLESLENSEQRFRSVAQTACDAIISTDSRGNIIVWNRGAEAVFGYTPDEALNMPFNSIIPERFHDSGKKGINRVLPTEDSSIIGKTVELIGLKKNGSEFPIELSLASWKTGAEAFFTAIIRDISERKQTERALKNSEERYALAQKVANIGSWDWNIQTGKLLWSEQIEPIFGFGKGKFPGTYEAFFDCVHPDDRRFVTTSVDACVEDGRDYKIEHRIVRTDGSLRWVSETGDVIRDQNGKAIRMLGIVQDITDRKLAEQQIQNLARFPSENPNPVLRIARDGTILHTNSAAATLLNHWNCRCNQTAPRDWCKLVAEALDSKSSIVSEFQLARKVLSFDIAPVTEAEYVNIYGRDVTKQKEAEKRILMLNLELEQRVDERTRELTLANKQLREEIEERKRLERELLSIIERERRRIGQELHDSIGQQLTGIQFMVKVLEKKLFAKSLPEASYAADIAAIAGQSMDQTRALAKGLHPVDLDTNSLTSVLHELASSTEHLFGIHCSFYCDKSVPVIDSSVAVNLYRIAQEAVTNAIKHGKAKNARITLTSSDDRAIMTIQSDGHDFPEVQTKSKGMGLQVMDYRAEMIGGVLDVRRPEKGGTIVTCIFPDKNINNTAE